MPLRKPELDAEITVIVPTYRRPAMLRRAVRSILAQTYSHLRVLILDNASGDETGNVAKRLAAADSRVSYDCHPQNLGSVGNFNAGMQRVETPFFAMLSDDDVCLPHFYQCAMEGFQAHPDAWFSSGVRVQVRQPSQIEAAPVAGWKPGRYDPPEGGLRILRDGLPGVIDSVFRREVLSEVSGFPSVVLGSDTDFMLRISLKHPFVLATSRPCAFFVAHDLGRAGLGPGAMFDELEPAYAGIIERIANDAAIAEDTRRHVREHFDAELRNRLLTAVVAYARQRQFDEASEVLERLERRWPGHSRTKQVRLVALAAEHVAPAVPMMNAATFVRRYLTKTRFVRQLSRDWPLGFQEATAHLHLLALD